MSFQQLGLCNSLLENVRRSGYTEPTPIQQATIPLVLAGKDVLGCAQTGTGKTAAFALPMLQRLKENAAGGKAGAAKGAKVIRALILSPTRELAQQTYDNFVLYGRGFGLTPCVLFGGVSQNAQTEALHRGADIVVACPGRLLDLMGQGLIRLDWLEIFVLDEADRMLDMGFIHDVRRIVKAIPEKRQTLLFSATMPEEVEKLAMDLLKDPETVKVDPVTSTVDAIDQSLYYVDKGNKKNLLIHLLQDSEVENALVFSRTKHGVDRIVRDLKRAGIDAAGIHGDKSQGQRQTALNRFKDGECKVLVATDIAARGIDIAGLSHVINYDQPMEPESYIHRIGRTGRAGRSGKAISFCCIDEIKQLNQVEKLIGRKLREEKSDWPMENFTPSPPKVRTPRPAKLGFNGEPLKEIRRFRGPQAETSADTRQGGTGRNAQNGKARSGKDGQPADTRQNDADRNAKNGNTRSGKNGQPADSRQNGADRSGKNARNGKNDRPAENRKASRDRKPEINGVAARDAKEPGKERTAARPEPVRRTLKDSARISFGTPLRAASLEEMKRQATENASKLTGNMLADSTPAREKKAAPAYDPSQHPGTPLHSDDDFSFEKFFH